MAETAINAQPRTLSGKRGSRKLRAQGFTPAVVYGHKEGTVALQIADDDVQKMLREGHKLVDLTVEGTSEKVIIRELQWDTFSKDVLHVDFLRVSKGELVEIELALEFVGDAPGLANGGVLEHPNMSLRATSPALRIPDAIKVDLSNLTIGESITVADMKNIPDHVTVLDEPETCVATMVDPAAIQAAVDADDAASEAAPAADAVPEVDEAGPADAPEGDPGDTAVVN